ncbi:hypothetical protein OQA88_1012 [Cercophora sp. LCS_1]
MASPPTATSAQPAIAVDPAFEDVNDTDSAHPSAPPFSSIANSTDAHIGGADKTEYWVPNDDTANEQLDINHHLLTLALDNKLFLAPVDKPAKVLDVGTGTGIWAIDFADEFLDADVTGVDISPIQPSWGPLNLKFELDDMTMDVSR